MDVDTVVMALGTSPNPLIRMADPTLEVNSKGCFVVDEETMRTSQEACMPGETLSPEPLRSSWPWAQAKRLRLPLTSIFRATAEHTS